MRSTIPFSNLLSSYTFILVSQQRLQTRFYLMLRTNSVAIVMKGVSKEDGKLYAIELNREIAILRQLKHVNIGGINDFMREDDGESISEVSNTHPSSM